ncbi:hypothetical protein DFAR_2920006 [Desulfarculales bacterium]
MRRPFLCAPCRKLFSQEQVARAIKKCAMMEPGQRVLVAVSGGKNFLVLWQVLCDLGYAADGIHLPLDLGASPWLPWPPAMRWLAAWSNPCTWPT